MERGVKVQMVNRRICPEVHSIENASTHLYLSTTIDNSALVGTDAKARDKMLCDRFPLVYQTQETNFSYPIASPYGHSDRLELRFRAPKTLYDTWEDFANDIKGCEFCYPLANPIETKLTQEEIEAFKELSTYYPITNLSVSSKQLAGYTVFNYPISMEAGWNYVKQQIGDTRDYIYDMDLQSAEAYVNSEYAVALTELEV